MTKSIFDVACYPVGENIPVWTMTQEAESPAWAIAQAVLPPSKRRGFVLDLEDRGQYGDLAVPHPLSSGYSLEAIQW